MHAELVLVTITVIDNADLQDLTTFVHKGPDSLFLLFIHSGDKCI